MKKGAWIGCGLAALAVVVVCGGFIALVASGVWGVIAMTQPVADGANDFLSLLAQDKISEAYASAAGVLRAQNDEAAFTAGVKKLGLTDYVSASWNNRHINNQSGAVEGTITTKSGTAPAKVELVYEQGKWRVLAVHYAGRDLADLMTAQVPAEDELRRLASESLTDLDQAVQAKDFTAFHGKISEQWQQQTTPAKLQDGFKDFIDKGVPLTPAKDAPPRIDGPATIDPKGLLVVGGDYQTVKPEKMSFQLKYIHEAGGWKLAAIHVFN